MLPLNYGSVSERDFLAASQTIAQKVSEGELTTIVHEINEIFFGGGPVAPKSFALLRSTAVPTLTGRAVGSNGIYCKISAKECESLFDLYNHPSVTLDHLLSYLEWLPLIGTIIAVGKAVVHLYAMISLYGLLMQESHNLDGAFERFTPSIIGQLFLPDSIERTVDQLFSATIDYTIHQNRLVASLLSLIPLLKPTVRISQFVLHYFSHQQDPSKSEESTCCKARFHLVETRA